MNSLLLYSDFEEEPWGEEKTGIKTRNAFPDHAFFIFYL